MLTILSTNIKSSINKTGFFQISCPYVNDIIYNSKCKKEKKHINE